jgi:ABC-type polysaccharide/polyol phosphate export permease
MEADSSRAVVPACAAVGTESEQSHASVLDVLVSLTLADLRFRYGRGGRRILKWLLDPFALVGVYLLFVTIVLKVGGRAPGLSLACAVVPFQLLMSTVINAMLAITTRRTIILNMAFNRLLIPISLVVTETIAFVASFSIIVLMMVIYDVPPTSAIGWLPLVVAANIFFAFGLAYPASLFGLWFRDLRNFGISFVRTLFFLAPGLVPLSQIPGGHEWLRLNPLTGIFESYRAVLLFGEAPAAWELLYPAGCAFVLLVLFVPLYNHEQRQFAKVVE